MRLFESVAGMNPGSKAARWRPRCATSPLVKLAALLQMSQDAAARRLNIDCSDPVLLNRNAAFGFDAEVAADTGGMDAGP
jgi:hypothetical protein